VFRAFPPNDQFAEMVITTRALPPPVPAPDMYLARVAPGASPDAVATELRHGGVSDTYGVATIDSLLRQEQRGLTAINVDGLGTIDVAPVLREP